jgi:hypothetical protein
MKKFYTLEEIKTLREKVRYYNLDLPANYTSLTDVELQTICNGIGPEDWSEDKRKALTDILQRYAPAAFLHDVAYTVSVCRLAADNQFLRNMKRIWAKDFGFWRWFRPSARIERRVIIPAVYAAVVLGGQEAFENAKKGGA